MGRCRRRAGARHHLCQPAHHQGAVCLLPRFFRQTVVCPFYPAVGERACFGERCDVARDNRVGNDAVITRFNDQDVAGKIGARLQCTVLGRTMLVQPKLDDLMANPRSHQNHS